MAAAVARAGSMQETDNVLAAFHRGGVPLLECRGICKQFGPVEALIDVDFDVYAGEVVALVGDNGAGKSTLTKAIVRHPAARPRHLRFEGKEVSIRSPGDATRLGIETVYQDLALCDNLDTVANLFLRRELEDPPLPAPAARCSRNRRWSSARPASCPTCGSRRIGSVHSPVAIAVRWSAASGRGRTSDARGTRSS